jgi:hypothetical protein
MTMTPGSRPAMLAAVGVPEVFPQADQEAQLAGVNLRP